VSDVCNLVVATPCFGGQVTGHYAVSLCKLGIALRAHPRIELNIAMVHGDALITRARANLVTRFLDTPTATHLLFIDADIGFEPEQVLRLLACDADMAAAVYPIKRLDWDRMRQAFQAGAARPETAGLHYVVELADPNHIEWKGDFVRVKYAGTGFLMIRRRALEQMCAHYSTLRYRTDHRYDRSLEGSSNRYALFESMIDPETGTYLSEDYAFCKRWTDLGGEIWADARSRLTHVGSLDFSGDFGSLFAGSPPAGD
jgi:hypothetical protein